MERLILAIVALPLLSAVLVQVLSPGLGRRVAHIGIAAVTGSFVCAVALLWHTIVQPALGHFVLGGSWGILLNDPLSALMALVVSGISLIVHLYSRRYMAEEPGYARFFALLNLMTAALLVMVAAGADRIDQVLAFPFDRA